MNLIIKIYRALGYRFQKWSMRLYNSLYKYSIKETDLLAVNAIITLYGEHLKSSNLGDDLNYYLIKELSHRKIFNYSGSFHRNLDNVMCIGSIVESMTNERSIIWGSGAIFGGDYPIKAKPQKVLAVRGPLTRQYLMSKGIDCPETYGDPALLLPYIYPPRIGKKRYKLGIIPHYIDWNNPYIRQIRTDKPQDIKLINLRKYSDWHRVIDEINECEFILSSSLHGLIISDAYSIPNVRIKLSENIIGGDFKFNDYFASVNRKNVAPISITAPFVISDFLPLKEEYVPIHFDPTPLLRSCPFPIKKDFPGIAL